MCERSLALVRFGPGNWTSRASESVRRALFTSAALESMSTVVRELSALRAAGSASVSTLTSALLDLGGGGRAGGGCASSP